MSKYNDEYVAIVKSVYPDLEEGQIKVFDDGWDYVVCVVDGKQAFRFPRRADYAKTLSREVDFLNEFRGQSQLKIPEFRLHKTEDNRPYVSYPFIQGRPFRVDCAKTLSSGELDNIAESLGRFLSVMHNFPKDRALEMGFRELDSVGEWSQRLSSIEKRVFSLLDENSRAWVTQLFTDFTEMIKEHPFENRLIHADIMPEHLIVDTRTNKLSGIIDFGDVEIGDPAYDFFFLQDYGQSFLEAVYQNYEIDVDSTFEKRRKFYRDRLHVTNLEHSVSKGDKDMIDMHLKQLSDFIKSH